MATGTAGQPHPKRPEKPSAVPPPPRDSDKVPDEIIALRPQEEGCRKLHFPLSSNANTPEAEEGELKGTEAEKGSELLPPGQVQLSSASLGRGLRESGSSFPEEVTNCQVSQGTGSQCSRSVGTGDI